MYSPAGTVKVAGNCTEGSLLVRFTINPVAGAGWVKFTWMLSLFPPIKRNAPPIDEIKPVVAPPPPPPVPPFAETPEDCVEEDGCKMSLFFWQLAKMNNAKKIDRVRFMLVCFLFVQQ